MGGVPAAARLHLGAENGRQGVLKYSHVPHGSVRCGDVWKIQHIHRVLVLGLLSPRAAEIHFGLRTYLSATGFFIMNFFEVFTAMSRFFWITAAADIGYGNIGSDCFGLLLLLLCSRCVCV